jgi:hypothetical protein
MTHIVTPDDIPVSVTRLIYTDPAGCVLSQNQAAVMFTHYWPAIREHFAQRLLDQNPDRDADFSSGVDWAVDLIRNS